MPQDFSKYEDYLNLLASQKQDPQQSAVPTPPTINPDDYGKYLDLLQKTPPAPAAASASTPSPAPSSAKPALTSDAEDDTSSDDNQDEEEPATKQSETVKSSSPLDFTGLRSGSQQNLADTLETQGRLNLIANMGRSFDKIGQSIAHVKGEENPVYSSIEKQAANLPKQYEMQVENQKNDPNSAISKGFRDFVEKKLGTPLKGDPSAADLEKVIPILFKDYEARLAEKGKLEAKKLDVAGKKEIAQENLQGRKDIAEMVAGSRADAAEKKAEETKSKSQTKAAQEALTFLNTSRKDPAVRQASLDNYNIGKAEAIMKNRDLNNLSNQEVGLLVSEISKVARGGVPTHEELKAISPNALAGQLSAVYSRLVNKPNPANAGAFLKQYQDYLKELKSNAQDVLSKQVHIVNAKRSAMGEDNYNTLTKEFADIFNPNKEQQPGNDSLVTPEIQNAAAIELARRKGQ